MNHLGDLHYGIPYICTCKKDGIMPVPYNNEWKKNEKLESFGTKV